MKNGDIIFLESTVYPGVTNDICKNILSKTKLIVFDRHGYKKKSLNSKIYKRLGEKRVFFIKFNKVNISSSQLKKI